MKGHWTDHLAGIEGCSLKKLPNGNLRVFYKGYYLLNLPSKRGSIERHQERWCTLTPEDLPLEIITCLASSPSYQIFGLACQKALLEEGL
jgi:hypothetical protein